VTIESEERRAEFDAIVAGLAQEFQPRTMSEHMAVQQLAGCYWKLAKVWTFDTEAAWRSQTANNLGLAEHDQLRMAGFGRELENIMNVQDRLFDRAGLGNPTITTSASANTILRYQGAINAMLFRCLASLERRHKERKASGEEFDERDYINEPTETDAPAKEAEPETPATENSAEKPAEPAKDAELHKRTQKTRRMLLFARTRK
jgi:hypothetical protein